MANVLKVFLWSEKYSAAKKKVTTDYYLLISVSFMNIW